MRRSSMAGVWRSRRWPVGVLTLAAPAWHHRRSTLSTAACRHGAMMAARGDISDFYKEFIFTMRFGHISAQNDDYLHQ